MVGLWDVAARHIAARPTRAPWMVTLQTRRTELARRIHPTQSHLGRVLEGLNVAFSVFIVFLWCWASYVDTLDTSPGLRGLTLLCCAFFIVRFLTQLWILPEPGHRLTGYILKTIPLVDAVTVVGAMLPVFTPKATLLTLSYLRCFVALHSWNSISIYIVHAPFKRAVLQGLFSAVCFLVTLGFSVAIAERAGDTGSFLVVQGKWSTWNALYFSVITSTTVGYGDITPTTAIGRFLVAFGVIIAILLSSWLAGRLLAHLAEAKTGMATFRDPTEVPLAIITGEVDRDGLLHALETLFETVVRGKGVKSTHSLTTISDPTLPPSLGLDRRTIRKVVILAEPSLFNDEDALFFENDPTWGSCVTYLRGSATNRDDLMRAGAFLPTCQCALFLVLPTTTSDEANLLRIISVARALPRLQIYAALVHTSSRRFLPSISETPIKFTPASANRFGILAANAVAPGVAPLLMTMLANKEAHTAATVVAVLAGKRHAGGDTPQPEEFPSWHKSFAKGLQCRVKQVPCPTWLMGHNMREAHLILMCVGLVHYLRVDAKRSPTSLAALLSLVASCPDTAGEQGCVLVGVAVAGGGVYVDVFNPRPLEGGDELFLFAPVGFRLPNHVDVADTELRQLVRGFLGTAPAPTAGSARFTAVTGSARKLAEGPEPSPAVVVEEEASPSLLSRKPSAFPPSHTPETVLRELPRNLEGHCVVMLQEWVFDLESLLLPLWRGTLETTHKSLPVVLVLPRGQAPKEHRLHAFLRRLATVYDHDVHARERRGEQSKLRAPHSPGGASPRSAGNNTSDSESDHGEGEEPPPEFHKRFTGATHPPVYFVEGALLHVNTLRRARVSYASRILLLSGSKSEEADGPTVLLTTLLESGLRSIRPAQLSVSSESRVPSRSVFMLGPVKHTQTGGGAYFFHAASPSKPAPPKSRMLTLAKLTSLRLRAPAPRAPGGELDTVRSAPAAAAAAAAFMRPLSDGTAANQQTDEDTRVTAAATNDVSLLLGWRWASRFAAGQLLDCKWCTVLLASSVQAPRLLDLCDHVLTSGNSQVVHCQVPDLPPAERTWAHVVAHFAQHGSLALGLWRAGEGAPLPFAYANPPLGERVHPLTDVVFVLLPCTALPSFEPAEQ